MLPLYLYKRVYVRKDYLSFAARFLAVQARKRTSGTTGEFKRMLGREIKFIFFLK
jgi:hypothetical protein